MIKYISTGNKHAAAIDSQGNLYIWGSGSSGELIVEEATKIKIPKKNFLKIHRKSSNVRLP